ncbi:MAG TPA: hypothetical protein VGA80_04570 [Flavobacteriaceae bacterium]
MSISNFLQQGTTPNDWKNVWFNNVNIAGTLTAQDPTEQAFLLNWHYPTNPDGPDNAFTTTAFLQKDYNGVVSLTLQGIAVGFPNPGPADGRPETMNALPLEYRPISDGVGEYRWILNAFVDADSRIWPLYILADGRLRWGGEFRTNIVTGVINSDAVELGPNEALSWPYLTIKYPTKIIL